MTFECVNKGKSRTEKWGGDIIAFKDYGSHYEIKIESRSSILVLIGKTNLGGFACVPDFRTGCHLANPSDLFWNTEQLTRIMGKVDGITVACAIKALADKIHF